MQHPDRRQKLLSDMLAAARAIIHNTAGWSMEDLVNDELRRKAMERDFIILGEAARRLRDEFKAAEQHPEIPWEGIISLRNVIVHVYDELDFNLIERAISRRLPELIQLLESILP